jgi:NAD(P)-dependent dehydrogenase (short-subunit alcohol dehydrogenase family)
MDIAGSNILITGGGSGIGAALARRFRDEGARAIMLVDRDLSAAERVAAELAGGTNALACEADVVDPAQVQAAVDRAEAEAGPLDLVCSNAGVFPRGDSLNGDANWSVSWNVNVMGNVHVARAVVPKMLARQRGYIVITCSAAGLLGNMDAPYMATKHAAVAFAEWLAIQYRSRGIRVSALCPLGVMTPMLNEVANGNPATLQGVLAGGDVVSPEAVAESVMRGVADERFLILPHPVVAERVLEKATDRDQWIAAMQKQFAIS